MAISPPKRRMLAIAVTAALGIGGALLAAAPASAATFTVTDPGDSGAGTLSDAIAQANTAGGGTIDFDLAANTITLANPLPAITKPLTIDGSSQPGAGSVTIDGAAVTGDGLVDTACLGSDSLTVSDITLTSFSGNGITTDCADVDLTGVSTTANGVSGLDITAQAGQTVSLTDITTTANAQDGLDLDAEGAGDTVTITDLTATGSTGVGSNLELDTGAAANITGSTFDGNDQGGLGSSTAGGATLTVSASSFTNNTPSGASSVGGITTESDGGTVVLDDVDVESNHGVFGAGILVPQITSNGSVAIENSHIVDNVADLAGLGSGGGVYVGLIDGTSSRFSVSDSTINDNDSALTGGGLMVQQASNGAPTGGVSVLRTTIDGNTSNAGGGVDISGWTANSSTAVPVVQISASTISNNSATETGGIILDDNGLADPGAGVVIDSSTIADNSATAGIGGIGLLDGTATTSYLITHSTISGNTGAAGEAGGLDAPNAPVTLDLDHTVVAGNGANDTLFSDPATALTAAWSLVQNPDSLTSTAMNGTDLSGVDPQLGPLADNGGPTQTMLPAASSPLIDAGDPAITGAPATDQRGLPRIVRTIDIGAVEVQSAIAAAPAKAALAATGSDPLPSSLAGLLLLLAGTALLLASRRRRTRGDAAIG
jgi:LPXTG-motif cell wall-anchored protein